MYSEEERRKIVLYHLTSGNSISKTAREFGLKSKTTLSYWLKKFAKSEESTTFAPNTQPLEPMQDKQEQELKKRIIELEAALQQEKLRTLALNTLIDLAEEQGIQIRKKSGAKQ